VVRPSPDVIVVDQPQRGELPISLDIQVKVSLGENVLVKTAGLDTRLAGSMDLKILGLKPGEMTARGQVRTVGGTYSGYGLSLRIDHGQFVYSGGPVENPGLNILALRKADDLERLYDVKVGLTVIGTLKNPIIRLYSQPAMRDEEILSYLLLGKPYDPKQGNLSLLLAGAQGLLAGSSPGVIDKLKAQLGIDTVDIQTGGGDISRSMVTVGKYLNPQLYVSYGYSVFSAEQLLKIRYRISKHWEIETWRGNALGADLFYRIEFY
jgi:translocation and assembly module TamB